jgi:tetratricopeptide (TPR) repeat protein
MGIAYYNKENHLKAAQHLEKALKFNASDATAMEYLYHSYMFSGRKREARVLSSKFTASLENKLQTGKINFFENLLLKICTLKQVRHSVIILKKMKENLLLDQIICSDGNKT